MACVYDGLCREELVINRDGSYTFKNAEHSKKAGVLAQKNITVLNLLTQKTDFGKIKSKKLTQFAPVPMMERKESTPFTSKNGLKLFQTVEFK